MISMCLYHMKSFFWRFLIIKNYKTLRKTYLFIYAIEVCTDEAVPYQEEKRAFKSIFIRSWRRCAARNGVGNDNKQFKCTLESVKMCLS